MRFAVKPWLIKIWYAPEQFRILDPLPLAHRRGIIACAVVMVICFLWPVKTPSSPKPQVISLASQTTPLLQANVVVPPVKADTVDQLPQEAVIHHNDADHQWHTYQIAPGQTMAQLFRDNHYPATDVYAMAQVEGSDKPLSHLQAGQTVHIRKNTAGVVTGLSIENDKDHQQVHFIRQPDGRFTLER